MLLKKMYKMLKIKNIEYEIPDITNLDTNAIVNAKINEVKNKNLVLLTWLPMFLLLLK